MKNLYKLVALLFLAIFLPTSAIAEGLVDQTDAVVAEEVWQIVPLANGQVAFKSFYGTFMSAGDGKQQWVVKHVNHCSTWESWQPISLANGKTAYKSYWGRFLSAGDGAQGWVLKNVDHCSSWEAFGVENASNGKVLRTFHNKFVRARQN